MSTRPERAAEWRMHMRYCRFALGLAIAGSACAALGQANPDKAANPAPATTPADAKSGDAAKGQTRPYHRAGGRTNREPTDTRIRGDGIKPPPCMTESRDSVDCPK